MAHNKIRQILPTILRKHFPSNFLDGQIQLAIGYGSGVFPQTKQVKVNTVDLLFIVKSAQQSHQCLLNSDSCKNDYSGLSYYLGSQYLSFLHNNIFPIHFNHPIIDGIKIKYGIIERYPFERDLRQWNILTLAGRMHKPVWFDVLGNSSYFNQFKPVIDQNYRKALTIALLRMIGRTNNRQIPLTQLYEEITQISYAGDIRNSLSIENKFKVSNIVKHNSALFHKIYHPLLQKLASNLQGGQKCIKLTENSIRIHYTPQLIYKLCLPQSLPKKILESLNQLQDNNKVTLGQYFLMNNVSELRRQINKCLTKINRKSSTWMAIQNFMGSSLIYNAQYIFAKLQKRNKQ